LAKSLSSFKHLALYEVSHQEGHIMAGILNHQELLASKSFITVHFSGGTSDIVKVGLEDGIIKNIETLMSGKDIHAGQLVDRVGVALGLPFPSGKYLEEMAKLSKGTGYPIIPAIVKEDGFSFSGAETRALQLINKNYERQDIAFAVFRAIANTIEKCLLSVKDDANADKVLLVGGVMANFAIRNRLIKRLEHPAVGLKLYFAQPELSTDNAVGVAVLAACYSKYKTC